MNSQQMLDALQVKIKEKVPGFEIQFKDQSTFMKILGKLMFFNKNFMTKYITTIGTKVYWPSKEKFEQSALESFLTLSHEYVHIMDYIRRPVRFVLGYLFPQVKAVLALIAVLAVISPWFLLALPCLLALAPWPAPYRKRAEIRGYGMSMKARLWLGWDINEGTMNHYVKQFTSTAYYFMWPFSKCVREEFVKWADPNNLECLNDPNPAYKDVYDIMKT